MGMHSSAEKSVSNVFVMGLDRFHQDLLETIEDEGSDYQFLTLYKTSEIVHPPDLEYPSMEEMCEHAGRLFRNFPDSVDGVMGYWDLPTSLAVPLIARTYGLPGPPLEAVARCEHKYWSRLEQAAIAPELIGRFQVINPFDSDPLATVELDYPFWIKPIKSHSSFLGYYIDRPETLLAHLPRIREKIGIMGRPMNEFLAHVDLPDEIAEIDGYHCIAEELVSQGEQCTLEGYGWKGEITVFGVVDSIRAGLYNSSFSRYQYPSRLPETVQQRMIEATRRLMLGIGYEGGAFNIEFYWDPDSDRIRVLEINARISKSHSPLFLMVDGATNQKVPLHLALGRKPDFPHRQGEFDLAAKFMLRYFEDGLIEHVPTREDVEKIQQLYPEARIRILATQGTHLSDLDLQDSYSFEVAEVFLGGSNEQELLTKYQDVIERLGFRISPQRKVAR